jgi:hypothetical protein
MKYTIYCILQPGELEIQSLLLLCSLKRSLLGDYQLFACIPDTGRDDFQFQLGTSDLLKDIGVLVFNFENPFLKSSQKLLEGDLFSNKYYPLPLLPKSDYTIFMDSDLLMIREFDLSGDLHGADFLAKPVCYMNESRWEELYGLFGLEVPSERILATVDQSEGPPYFNGGVFSIKSSLTVDLSKTWIETFEKITKSNIMHDNLVNREQAALAISIARLKLSYHPLSEYLNFPARSKQIPEDTIPALIHYHDPESIYKNKNAVQVIRKLFLEYPVLFEIASKLKNWRILTDHPAATGQTLKRLKHRLKGYYQARMFR